MFVVFVDSCTGIDVMLNEIASINAVQDKDPGRDSVMLEAENRWRHFSCMKKSPLSAGVVSRDRLLPVAICKQDNR